MRGIRSIPLGYRLSTFALVALVAVALVCAWQVLSGFLGGEVFTDAAGRSLWIHWPNVPDLFIRAMLFYGLGLVISSACAAIIGLSLIDSISHDKDESRE